MKLTNIPIHVDTNLNPVGHVSCDNGYSAHCDLNCVPAHDNSLGHTFAFAEAALAELLAHLRDEHEMTTSLDGDSEDSEP